MTHTLNRWTEDGILSALRSYVSLNGTLPGEREYKALKPEGMPSLDTIKRRFGNYNCALSAIGVTPHYMQERWTDEDVIRALQDYAQVNGHPPTANDLGGSLPTQKTLIRRYGSLTLALQAAGLPTYLEWKAGETARLKREERQRKQDHRYSYDERMKRLATRLERHSSYEGDCLVWTGVTNEKGYGILLERVRTMKVKHRAHRLAYELTYGHIPEGYHVHHECGVTSCIEPKHLRAVTPEEHKAIHYGTEGG